jgi:two-component system, LytTR family, response regulator
MFLSNLHTNTLFYGLIIGGVVAHRAWERRRPEPAADSPPAPLQVRSKGRTRLVPVAEVEWIGAAGNYAELHLASETHLVDESLASLERRLPRSDFARIHRGAIVQLARITEVGSLGRGDAIVRLSSGAELRLSRRYRPNLEPWLRKR